MGLQELFGPAGHVEAKALVLGLQECYILHSVNWSAIHDVSRQMLT